MFPYKRLNEIFEILKQSKYTSPKELASRFAVTDRTIRNDIQEINTILENHGAVINLKRKHGYYIHITNQVYYQSLLDILDQTIVNSIELDSSWDRIHYILYMLLSSDDYISLSAIINTVFISRNTLNNYIKEIKNILENYHLEYISKPNSGIKIIGSENDKRKCMMEHIFTKDIENHLIDFTQNERALFHDIDLDCLRQITLSKLDEYNVKTSDYHAKNLMIHLALMISRVRSNHYINTVEIKTNPSILKISDSLCKEIETQFDIIISKGEKIYIYLHLISNTHMEAMDIDDEWLHSSITKVLEIIHENYNFDLRQDVVLKEDLFRHMKSIFTSKSFGLDTRNPLLNTIKNNYPLPFEVALTALSKVYQSPPFILNEEDVGYISVHIGAAIERYFAQNLDKKNVILVCGSGQATTRMLETRLNLYFPNKIHIAGFSSYNEYHSYTKQDLEHIDFAISTVPLNNDILPSITVNFALKKEDIESISKFLNCFHTKEQTLQSAFFDRNLFFKFKEVSSKENLLRIMSNKLLEYNIVYDDFLSSVLERESLGNTNMNEIFALAHPMKLRAKDTKVAVAILEKPLLWHENESVQIIFLLAIKPGIPKDLEHLYDNFIEIVNDSKLQQKIIAADNYDEFISLLK